MRHTSLFLQSMQDEVGEPILITSVWIQKKIYHRATEGTEWEEKNFFCARDSAKENGSRGRTVREKELISFFTASWRKSHSGGRVILPTISRQRGVLFSLSSEKKRFSSYSVFSVPLWWMSYLKPRLIKVLGIFWRILLG